MTPRTILTAASGAFAVAFVVGLAVGAVGAR